MKKAVFLVFVLIGSLASAAELKSGMILNYTATDRTEPKDQDPVSIKILDDGFGSLEMGPDEYQLEIKGRNGNNQHVLTGARSGMDYEVILNDDLNTGTYSITSPFHADFDLTRKQ